MAAFNTLLVPGHTTTLTVHGIDGVMRLDAFLAQRYPQYSRTFFRKLIDDGHIIIHGGSQTKASLPIKQGAIILVHVPAVCPLEHNVQSLHHLAVTVVYQHTHFLIINKPPSLIVHTPGAGHTDATLVDWLIQHFHDIQAVGASDRPGIVHRLDKDTSGLMIIARNNYAHRQLSDLFKERLIKKTYLAVVQGHPPAEGRIDFKIRRHPINRIQMTHSTIEGRDAITEYTVKTYFQENSLIEVHPLTGRTHQIRVHLTALGHAIVGDGLYGSQTALIARQALHASALHFSLENELFAFYQEPPTDFRTLVERLP